tara:strand:- start:98 stop:1039 length:942 start_codon:yes stop_codon:yes gene_type:complete
MKNLIRQIIKEETSKIIIEASMDQFPLVTDKFNIGFDATGLGDKRDQSLPGMISSPPSSSKYLLSKTQALHNSDYHPTRHHGIDIFALKGENAYAPVTGEIVKLGAHGTDGGNGITIKRADEMYFRMVHMDDLSSLLTVGDTINAGDYFGTVGNSGNAGGKHAHIHFSVHGPAPKWKNSVYHNEVDPCPYLQGLGFDVECDRSKTSDEDIGSPHAIIDKDTDMSGWVEFNDELIKRRKEKEEVNDKVDTSLDDEIESITGPIDRSPPINVTTVDELPDPTTVPNIYAFVGDDEYKKNKRGDKWIKVEKPNLYD